MGAIARQVLQVKRKNSTNWTCPEARLTVVGSVASSSEPREVAMGNGVAATALVGSSVASLRAGSVVGSRVEAARVVLGSSIVVTGVAAAGGLVAVDAGAQAPSKRAIRIRLVQNIVEGLARRRVFMISL
jgi:hypothetical protein